MHPLVLDGETTRAPFLMPYMPEAYMVQFGALSRGEHTSWLYNHPEATQSFRQNNKELQELVDDASILIAHNMKFDLMWLMKMGINLAGKRLWCTQVAQYALEGQFKGPKGYYGLDQVAARRGTPGKTDIVKLYWDSGYETDEIPANILIPYNQQDNQVAWDVYCQQVQELMQHKKHLIPTLKMQMQMIPLLAEIEMNGMLVHQERMKELNEEYVRVVADYNRELSDISGEDISWDSKQQVSCLLFGGEYTIKQKEDFLFYYKGHNEYGSWRQRNVDMGRRLSGLGFTPPKGSETKKPGIYSVADGVIQGLKATSKSQKRFLEVYSLRQKAEKLRGTYFEGMQSKLIEGYVHSSMNQTIARNARLTSSNPNNQNLPRSGTGPVKQIYISRFD